MTGHWYVRLTHNTTGEQVEAAIPCQLAGTIEAIEVLEHHWPDWTHKPGGITRRAAFCQHCLPANSQHDYSAYNTSMNTPQAAIHSDAPPWR